MYANTNPPAFQIFTQNYEIIPGISARSAVDCEVIADIWLCYRK